MIFTLLVPFLFMLFMSADINKVWTLYGNMQLLSNYIDLGMIAIPAASFTLLGVLKNVSYFSIGKHPQVKYWIE